ncbi:MAG: hypothetical protein ACI8PB_002486 [Desulforhopalus sp.]|jgi:hypothetical protein
MLLAPQAIIGFKEGMLNIYGSTAVIVVPVTNRICFAMMFQD